jgi:hypothetical protein
MAVSMSSISKPTNPKPLKLSGLLDQYKQKISVPAIGTEFFDVDLVELMEASNSDDLLREIAILGV